MTAARVAFLSTAHIHARGFIDSFLKASDGRKVAAVWDDIPDRGRRHAELAGARFEADLDALVSDPSVDGFIIAAENTRHMPLLRKALPAGKPVFCEKPLLTSRAELEELKTLHARHPAPLISGYFQPFGPELQAAAALIRAGTFGKITRVRYRNAHHAAYGRWFDRPDVAWFTDPGLAGGGAFLDLGTHAIHALLTLFGPVREVFAAIGNDSGVYPSCDDNGVALLRFAGGALGTVEAAWTQTGGINGLEVAGSEKSLWHNGERYVVGAPGSTPIPLEPAPARPACVDRLVAVIGGEIAAAELAADLAACLGAVAVMESAYASARSGRWTAV